MKTGVLKKGIRPRRRARAGRWALLAATLVVGAFVFAPASAGLPLDLEVPPLPPLPLPTLSPSTELPVSGTIDGVTTTVDGVTQTITGTVGGTVGGDKPAPAPKGAVVPKATSADTWSLERLPAMQGPGASETARTAVSSTKLGRPGSYTSLVGGGLRSAAGRAARLAGPLAAPLAVAMFALVMLVIAARGPGRLVKVEEERQAFVERRSYRL